MGSCILIISSLNGGAWILIIGKHLNIQPMKLKICIFERCQKFRAWIPHRSMQKLNKFTDVFRIFLKYLSWNTFCIFPAYTTRLFPLLFWRSCRDIWSIFVLFIGICIGVVYSGVLVTTFFVWPDTHMSDMSDRQTCAPWWEVIKQGTNL